MRVLYQQTNEQRKGEREINLSKQEVYYMKKVISQIIGENVDIFNKDVGNYQEKG